MKKALKRRGLAVLLIFASLAFIIVLRAMFSNGFLRDANYKVLVKIEASREDDSVEQYVLEAITIEGVTKIKADFFQHSVFAVDGKVIFDVGGKYLFYNMERSFKDLLTILERVPLGEPIASEGDFKSYNPEVSKEILNDVLRILFINRSTDSQVSAQYVLSRNKVKNFSVYLVDVEGYKDINIAMTFEEVKEKDGFDVPVFYRDIMEEIEFEKYAMIK